jgi:hypothetical protein
MNHSAVAERRRRDPQLIGDFVARPAFLHAFQSAVKQLQAVFPSRYRRSFAANALDAMRSRVSSEDRLLLVSGGRLCAMLARRLLCFNGECAVRDALRLGTSALSRRHFFRNLCGDSTGAPRICFRCYVPPNGATSGNLLRRYREFVVLIIRRIEGDLCGNSGGEQIQCFFCGVSPNGAPFGNRLLRQDCENMAAFPRQHVCDLCGDSGGAQQLC